MPSPDYLSFGVLSFITAQRIAELVLAEVNTRRLKGLGAQEFGAGHYPWIVALHACWLVSLWVIALDIRPDVRWLVVLALLQVFRIWVLVTLGGRWTTRIIVLPNAPLITTGPYRYVAHPNYFVVVGEIFVLPMAYGLLAHALAFSFLNAVVLAVRIRAENEALGRTGAMI